MTTTKRRYEVCPNCAIVNPAEAQTCSSCGYDFPPEMLPQSVPIIIADTRKTECYDAPQTELITFEEVEGLRRQNERLRGEIEALKKAAASPEIPFRLYREINASEIISMYLSEIREATLCPLLQAHNVQVHVYDCEQDYWHEGWPDQAVYRIMIKERP